MAAKVSLDKRRISIEDVRKHISKKPHQTLQMFFGK